MRYLYSFLFVFFFYNAEAQYDSALINRKKYIFNGFSVGVVKMSRADNHVKIKYFAARDANRTSVAQRYERWAKGKNIHKS